MNKFMKEAINEARRGIRNNHGGPFGAVIVKNGKIMSRGHNEVVLKNDPTAHAEINAIKRASAKTKSFDLSGCEIYVTCEPCPMCLAAIHWARIGKVIYGCTKKDAAKIGFDDKLIYAAIRGNSRKKYVKTVQVEKSECSKVMKEWQEKEDKIMY